MRWQGGEQEEVRLADGTRLTLRAIRPDDKPLLARGMQRLSPESRWSRFHYSRGELSDAELTYLTELDGSDHFALGALADDGEGVAVARYIRTEPGGEIAEAALAVADDYQNRGLGRILLERLVNAARERGVTRFRAEVLAENAPMQALLRKLGASEPLLGDGEPGVTVLELPLPATSPEPEGGLLAELFRLFAQGLVRIRPGQRR